MKKALFLILFIFISYIDTALAQGAGEIFALYPQGASVAWQNVKTGEVNGTKATLNLYESSYSQDEIIKFYEEALSNKGWQLLNRWDKFGLAYFSNGKEHLYIFIMSKMKFYLCYSQEPIHLCAHYDTVELKDDIPGRDLSFIPRYTNSVRRGSVIREDNAEALLDYATYDSPKQVADFFKNNLKQQGWQITVDAQNQLMFQNQENKLFIMIYKVPDAKMTGITMSLNVGEGI